MTTYYANFNANNGTRFQNPIKDTNLKRIIKSIRETAEGERFANNECLWSVWIEDDPFLGACRCVAKGGMHSNGQRYRVSLSDLAYM